MTEIKIKRLALENFKSHRNLILTFDGSNASIYGDNATGKTSIYDALTWLLFGKDSHGNGEKNIEVKPLNAAGEVADHQAVTEVEAVLLANGEEISLRRTLREVWTTKRGSLEPTYDGNTSDYAVNGVPCQKKAFTDKVNELVDEDTFRMLTSVSHFAADLPWQERRAVLFQVAGVLDDKQIMATREDFRPLLEAVANLTPEDFKKKLLAEKKSHVSARNEIPARISECQKTIDDLGSLDFDTAKAEADILSARKESIAAELITISHSTAADGKKVELQQAQLELDKLEAENRQYRLSQQNSGPDIIGMKMSLRQHEESLAFAKRDKERLEEALEKYEATISQSRDQWMAVNGETFNGGNCPTCGQTLPADKLKASKDKFEAEKQQRLRNIEQVANDAKKRKTDTEESIASKNTYISETEAIVARKAAEVQAAEGNTITVTDMDGYAEKVKAINSWIKQLQEELHKLSQDAYAAGEEKRKQLAEVNAQIAEKMAIVSKKAALDYALGRIESLREDAAKAAEQLTVIEKWLYVLEEFTRYKTSFVEDSINGLFRIAKFRLFREQANGGIEDRCDVVVDGVPYIGLNNGMKINVGIDIINTLAKTYGVTVPLFVDNAESVTKLETADMQIIRLVVSENDKELRVNYEN